MDRRAFLASIAALLTSAAVPLQQLTSYIGRVGRPIEVIPPANVVDGDLLIRIVATDGEMNVAYQTYFGMMDNAWTELLTQPYDTGGEAMERITAYRNVDMEKPFG